MDSIITPQDLQFFYQGPSIDKGKLPAFFYITMTAEESLIVPPYNTPAMAFKNPKSRVFSVTLPFHVGKTTYESPAIKYWAEEIAKGNYPLEEFIEKMVQSIQWLIKENIVEDKKFALGGLSRGAFFATHVASKIPTCHYLLSFAPLTHLTTLEEFAKFSDDPRFQSRLDRLNLVSLVEQLTHVHFFRFYIGNRDSRVGTDNCYHFFRAVSEKAHDKKARHMHLELFISPSIGHQGHGTPPHIFEEGANWLKHHLVNL